MSGRLSHRAGLSAEASVAAHYAAAGAQCLARRWRGGGGEIDLVVEDRGVTVFVEVKKARSFDAAAHRIGAAQRARIEVAAGVYLAGAKCGMDTDCRFDAALVDSVGRVRIVENAFH